MEINVGNGNDLKIYHSSTSNDSHIDTSTGNFYIRTNGSENSALFVKNAGVKLYHNDVQKFETTADGVTVTGTVSDSKGNLRSIPKNNQSSAYTLVAADAGKCVMQASGGVTIPASVFSTGDAVTIINDSGSDQTLTQASGVSMFNAADASQGNRTLAGRGMATIWWSTATTCYISGAGLS